MIFHRAGSELIALASPSNFVIDRRYVARFAQAHAESGFERVLIGTASIAPEGSQVAAYAATQTERLSFLEAMESAWARARPDRVTRAGADGLLELEAIVEVHFQLHQQHRSAWTQGLDLRPHKESI